tara:strand:- start:845 stop:1903 length:1059 start_codon:yes stop_codon:yes gene_type:complete
MIPVAKPNLEGNELKYISECINGGWISSSGKFITKFEEEFAKFCGTNYATSTSNGTTALHLALLAIGIKEGDEVIVPNLTFATTANVVKHCGATPILVDVEKNTWNISPDEIRKNITLKTKAIIPVHLYGNPCDMNPIMNIAEEHNLIVIEDAAEAHGAEYKGRKVGSIGHIGCFSFFGNKIITTGEGGMCTSNDKKIINKINLLKNHGMTKEKRYWHDQVGYNYRMTNMQAAVGLAQLERVSNFLEKRHKIANIYKKHLKNIEFQKITNNSKHSQWFVSIITKNREKIIEKLKSKGIDTRKVFYPLSEMPPYKNNLTYPNSEYISKNGLSLPTYIDLTEKEIKEICDEIVE